MFSVLEHHFQKRKVIIFSGLILGVILCVCLLGFLHFKTETVNSFKKIQASQNVNTVFYDIDQRPFHIIQGEEDRKYIPLRHISRNLQMAVVAVEDARFFKHFGFDPIRIGGVIIKNLVPGAPIQGASTLTQQLVKLTLLSPERTLERKIRELFMAIALEMEFSKAEILEFYLNKVYLGHRNYGVENASLNYFHKSTSDLTIAESAFIAGLIKKPEGYSPFTNLKKARDRQILVLKRLRDLKWISREEYTAAINEYLLIREQRKSELQQAPYFVSHILLELKKKYGHNMIYGGGLHIYTTLDRKLQKAMEDTINIRMTEERSFEEIAGVSIDPSTGFVKALVGGSDFYKSEFNRVTQARRQPGSAFKPILYASALAKGVRPQDVFWDEPTQYSRLVDEEIEVYEPGNFGGDHLGQITLAYALRVSNNVVSVQVLNKIGISYMVNFAQRFGIDLPGEQGLCLALGCGETSLLNLVGAYTVFANQGYRNKPTFVLRVLDSQGEVLEKHQPEKETQVLSVDHAFQMNRLLKDVVSLGTGKNAKSTFPSAGKTGTSDDNRDAWYIGYTANLVSGFWVGNDNNESMIDEVGGRTPARLWKSYMESIPSPEIRRDFPLNDHFEEYLICDNSGKLATAYCPSKTWYSFEKQSTPWEFCDLHSEEVRVVEICRTSNRLATRYCPLSEIETKSFVTGTEPKSGCDVHRALEPGP